MSNSINIGSLFIDISNLFLGLPDGQVVVLVTGILVCFWCGFISFMSAIHDFTERPHSRSADDLVISAFQTLRGYLKLILGSIFLVGLFLLLSKLNWTYHFN